MLPLRLTKCYPLLTQYCPLQGEGGGGVPLVGAGEGPDRDGVLEARPGGAGRAEKRAHTSGHGGRGGARRAGGGGGVRGPNPGLSDSSHDLTIEARLSSEETLRLLLSGLTLFIAPPPPQGGGFDGFV
eukprot:641448-Prorocentrum_minimum.AAC.2